MINGSAEMVSPEINKQHPPRQPLNSRVKKEESLSWKCKASKKINPSSSFFYTLHTLLCTASTHKAFLQRLKFDKNALKIKTCTGESASSLSGSGPQPLEERQICVSEHWLTVIRHHCKYGKFHASQMLDVREWGWLCWHPWSKVKALEY